ncbi:hypothetical protein AB0L39_28715 [Streptomyces parvus]|uniref:hypothetical protein n=1 Tax=Streptomyces parvus TaxID=66428 RepID=UPI003438C415
MGMDLTLFMADWGWLGAVPVESRTGLLEDAAWPEESDVLSSPGRERAHGWRSPPGPGAAWCAEYGFTTTTGAYAPHARAGDAWADTRLLIGPSVREPMDTFLDGLVWEADPASTGGRGFLSPVVAGRLHRNILLACPPEALPGKARAWERVELRLEELRAPFAAACEGWAGRPETFEDFVALLREWGDVTATAARRGWGLVGLP